jgi:hypothetical protein
MSTTKQASTLTPLTQLTLTFLALLTGASGAGSGDVSGSHPANPEVTSINLQQTAQRRQFTFRHNSSINRRTRTKATTHTGTDAAAGAGNPSFIFFDNSKTVMTFVVKLEQKWPNLGIFVLFQDFSHVPSNRF